MPERLSSFVDIEPRDIIHSDVVGVYPLTFMGDVENTGDRLQAVANQTGIVIKVVDLLEQKRATIFDLKARDALRPGPNFIDTCQRQSARVLSEVQGFEHRIGIGHSLGGVIITGMQRYGEEEPFTGVELCDAFNLSGLQHAGFLTYQLMDFLRSRITRKINPVTPDIARDWSAYSEGRGDTSIIARINNLSDLMRSSESKLGVMSLAADAGLPLHVIGLDRGLSTAPNILQGSKKYLQPFFRELRAIRDGAVDSSSTFAPLKITRIAGWHSDILSSSLGAENLLTTIELVKSPATAKK